eukprot:1159320-Pelagomonas_calceolata.AAC.14
MYGISLAGELVQFQISTGHKVVDPTCRSKGSVCPPARAAPAWPRHKVPQHVLPRTGTACVYVCVCVKLVGFESRGCHEALIWALDWNRYIESAQAKDKIKQPEQA